MGSQPLVTQAPTPTAMWSGEGCPKAWVSNGSYKEGELAEVDGVVYQCSTSHASVWCGNMNYKPGDSLYWEESWTVLGSCDGTIAPTTSPNYQSLAHYGGCPDEFVSGTAYEADDKVTVGSIVYQCRSWPSSAWCSMYEPGSANSKEAWTIVGYCEGEMDIYSLISNCYLDVGPILYLFAQFPIGTMSPTTSPAFSSIEDVGDCPLDYTSNGSYEAGDKVSVKGNGMEKIVYECKAFPNDQYCNQYGPEHWSRLGWMLVGYCEGELHLFLSFKSIFDIAIS